MGNTVSKIHKAEGGWRNRRSHTVSTQSEIPENSARRADGAKSENFTDEIDKLTTIVSSHVFIHKKWTIIIFWHDKIKYYIVVGLIMIQKQLHDDEDETTMIINQSELKQE